MSKKKKKKEVHSPVSKQNKIEYDMFSSKPYTRYRNNVEKGVIYSLGKSKKES